MIHEPPVPTPAAGQDAEVITAEWRRRTEAEYTSAVIAQQVTLWLLQVGAPPDLVRDGLAVVEDEMTHSELSAAVADRAGGDAGAPVIDPARLIVGGGDDPVGSLISSTLRYFCIGETIAVPLFRMLRRRCTVPVAVHALDRILRDEARHRQLGWDVLDWALLAGGTSVRDAVTEQAPAMLQAAAGAYACSIDGDGGDARLSPAVQAWGLAPPREYSSTVSTSLAADVLPRLAVRGVSLPIKVPVESD